MATSESVEIDDLTTIDSITRQHLEVIEPVRRALSSSPHTPSVSAKEEMGSHAGSSKSDSTLDTTTGAASLEELDTIVHAVKERQRSGTPPSPSIRQASRTPSPTLTQKSKGKRIWYPAARPPSPRSSPEKNQEMVYRSITSASPDRQAKVEPSSSNRPYTLKPISPSDRDSIPQRGKDQSNRQHRKPPPSPEKRTSTQVSQSSEEGSPFLAPGYQPLPHSTSQPIPNHEVPPKSSLKDLPSPPTSLDAPQFEERPSTLVGNGPKTIADRLSQYPDTDLDSEVRERYLLACGLLKSALVQRDAALLPAEKMFLEELLREDDESTVSMSQVSAVQSATYTLVSDPIFQVGSVATTAFEEAQDPFNITGETGITTMLEGKDPERERKRKTLASFASFDGRDYPFRILGADMKKPKVLTPALMEALRGFFPLEVSQQNFWLKFRLKREGKTLKTLLSHVRTTRYTLICVETKDGNVFGAFCSTPWRLQRSWYGSKNCFLWRLKNSRYDTETKTRNFAHDNIVEVFPFTGHDSMIQYCTKRTLAVGGGDWGVSETDPHNDQQTGIGLTIDGDLMGGETNGCATFASRRLTGPMSESNEFEIQGLEVWTLTPCNTIEEAERAEIQQLFVVGNV